MKHQLQNAQIVLSTTPDSAIAQWREASYALLKQIAGPSAKNFEHQFERQDLEGAWDGKCWIAARIRFDAEILSTDLARLKHESELLDSAIRTPVLKPKQMH
jgi:hypothetical protein